MKGKFIILESIDMGIIPGRKIFDKIMELDLKLPPAITQCHLTLDRALTIVSEPITRMDNYKELIYRDYRLMNMMYASNRYINYVLMRDDMINKGTSYIHQSGFLDTIVNEAIPYYDNKKIYHDAIKFGIEQHIKSCREVLIPNAHFYIYMNPKELVDHQCKTSGDIQFNADELAEHIEKYEKLDKVFTDVKNTYERATGDSINVIFYYDMTEKQVVDEIWSYVEPLFQEEK